VFSGAPQCEDARGGKAGVCTYTVRPSPASRRLDGRPVCLSATVLLSSYPVLEERALRRAALSISSSRESETLSREKEIP
jgi:hypothetical protein